MDTPLLTDGWRKSSYSGGQTNCVEVAASEFDANGSPQRSGNAARPTAPKLWLKASYSGSQTACVELASGTDTIHVRDTKCRRQGRLDVPQPAWQSLITRL